MGAPKALGTGLKLGGGGMMGALFGNIKKPAIPVAPTILKPSVEKPEKVEEVEIKIPVEKP